MHIPHKLGHVEQIEAHYAPDGPKFSRIWAEVSLDWYLLAAMNKLHDVQKPKTRAVGGTK